MFNNLIQFAIVLAIMLALVPVVGKWLAHAFTARATRGSNAGPMRCSA